VKKDIGSWPRTTNNAAASADRARASLPDDLVTVREAVGKMADPLINHATVRGWIYQGRGGLRLKTYRLPGDAHHVLVSMGEAETFIKRAVRSRARRERKVGYGRTSFTLEDAAANGLRALAAAYTKRLGVVITLSVAVQLSIKNALRAEGCEDSEDEK